VVVSDGKQIIDANKKLYDFLGLYDLESFKKEYDCVCDLFLPNLKDGENYLQKITQNIPWNQYLIQNQDDTHFVKMFSKSTQKVHIFQISISYFDENFIINFYDITTQKELEEKLNDINKDLEVHIKEEIEKNRKKDQAILQQSRMAQMGELISMIAHQWRQPLATLSSILITIKFKFAFKNFDLDTKEGQTQFIAYLENEILDMEELINTLTITIDDFRDFYAPDNIKQSVSPIIPIKKAFSILKRELLIQEVNVVETYDFEEELFLYENEFMHVVLNILKNALDNFVEKKIKERVIQIEIKN